MRLSNEGLEIETEQVKHLFPANFIIVDWECEAINQYDSATDDEYFEFEDIQMTGFYYNSDNELKRLILTLDQTIWITPFIETDAEKELEKQK